MLPRSALSTDTPPPPQHVYVLEPVIQEEEAQEPPQYSKVVVVSAMQEAPCVTEGGDELHYLSVLNKQASGLPRLCNWPGPPANGCDELCSVSDALPLRLEGHNERSLWTLH